MVADAGLGSRRAHFYPPSWHIFAERGRISCFRPPGHTNFAFLLFHTFRIWRLTIFSPRGDHVFAHFRAQILSGANCLNVAYIIHTCFQWFCHHLSETKSRWVPGSLFVRLVIKILASGWPIFWKFPITLFKYFGDQKLLEFCFVFDNIWAPAAPWWDVRMPGNPGV